MPDGSMQAGRIAAENKVDRDLVHWGEVLLQGASGQELGARDEREPVPRIPWTGKQEAEAWATDRQVNLLDPIQRIVLRVFYRARQARYWDELEPDKRRDICDELTREINVRVRRYSAEIGELPRTIRGHRVEIMRDAAIRSLVASRQQQRIVV